MDFQKQIIAHYDRLKDVCREVWEPHDLEKIEKAFLFTQNIIGKSKFTTGEYILTHSLDVATIIAEEIGLGPDSIVAGLLHNILYADLEKKATRENIEKELSKPVYSIITGMAKINALGTDTVDLHSENYRKLLLAMQSLKIIVS